MKPTQQQIEAALRYADFKETNQDFHQLKAHENSPAYAMTSARILAAAYRELLAENERLKKELQAEWDLQAGEDI